MLYTLQQIRNEVIRAIGANPSNVATSLTDSIDLRINQIQDYICYHKSWAWRQRTHWLTTRPPYTTGTVAVTQGSRTVTGTSTVWTDDMKHGEIVIDGRAYDIDRVASGTSIILKSPYHRTTSSSETYGIYFRKYTVPSFFASIVDIYFENAELISTQKSFREIVTLYSRPSAFYVGEVADEAFYNSGTVDVTNDSASVVGNSTTFTANMEGMSFRVRGVSDVYTVRERTSNTALTLDRPYTGSTAATTNYDINPQGTVMLGLDPMPDDYYTLRIEGLVRPMKLVGNNDISIIPNHTPLIKGAIWLAKIDKEDTSAVMKQTAEAEFLRSLAQLEQEYKAIKAPRFLSEEEAISRKIGRTPLFDPLRSKR